MGQWLLLPQAEEMIAARISVGMQIRGYGSRPRMNRGDPNGPIDLLVFFHSKDIANMSEIEGIDFDVVNKDLCDYFHDCED